MIQEYCMKGNIMFNQHNNDFLYSLQNLFQTLTFLLNVFHLSAFLTFLFQNQFSLRICIHIEKMCYPFQYKEIKMTIIYIYIIR